jgi:hypothetical protein
MSHMLSNRKRPASPYTPQQNVVYYLDLGRRAREAEEARIAELLGPAGMELAREIMGAEVLDALAVTS